MSERLATVRTVVVGVVLVWLLLVAAWAFDRGLTLYAATEREREVRAARLRLAGVDELQGVFNTVNGVIEPAVVKIDVARPQSRVGPPGPGAEVNSGSGVIVQVETGGRRPHGFVVTNEHVVRNPGGVVVTLSDGRRVEARVIGTDPQSDLAVLRVAADGLVAAEWGDSNALRKGDWVLAFGSPFGFVGSMTAGIVSALNRTQSDAVLSPFREAAYQDFIQVDAAINPGNSGGPLVDVTGRVVGINTAIFTRTGDFSGIGFAIPSNQARRVFDDLRDNGRVIRGYVGISPRSVDEIPGAAERLGLPDGGGVLVERVFRDTPAAAAGLRRGDVIVSVDGRDVNDSIRFRNLAGFARPGDTLRLGVVRGGAELEVRLEVGELPDGQLALNLQPLEDNPYGLDLADAPDGGPPVVSGVTPDGAAAAAGLRPGDRVFGADGQPVRSAAEALDVISRPPPQLGVEVRVMSGGRVFNVLLRSE